MKEKPRESVALPPPKTVGDALPWSPRARGIASVLIALHVVALFVAPWSMPPPASQLSGEFAGVFQPYLNAVFIYHGYRFFAPDPGASHIVQYELTFADGRQEKGQFPDLKRHWPRLLYHRHFMLSEMLYQVSGIPAEPPPPPPANMPPRIRRQVMSEYNEILKQHEKGLRDRDLLVDSVAQRLLAESGAVKVKLWAVEHEILSPQQVLDGMLLTREETYVKRPLGEFARGTP